MKNKIVLIICLVCLLIFYVFQKNILGALDNLDWGKPNIFLLKKTIRFFVNDFLMIGVIYGLFNKKDYVKIAFIVQVFGFVFFLTPYILLRLFLIEYNGPLVSFLHRLVLNPLLLILLIPAFYYQKKITRQNE